MIKIIGTLVKNKALSKEEFIKFCLETDAVKCKKLPGLRKISYSFVNDDIPPSGPQKYDGLVELWFDNVEAMNAAFATPLGKEIVDDEAKFLDRDYLTVLVTDEHEFVL